MNKILISIIVAIDKNRGIGKDGKIPWHIKEDFAWFKEKTLGHTVIMGRKTFESIGKPLSKRENIIVTRDKNFKKSGTSIVHSIEQALQLAKQDTSNDEIFIIGGAQIYEQALPFADRVYLTKVDGDFYCDAFFPDYSEFKKEKILKSGESNGLKYTILQLER